MMDERTMSIQRRTRSEAFAILFFGLLIVMLYRKLVLGLSIGDYLDVAVAWLVSGVYVVVATVMRGVHPAWETSRKWLPGVVVGLILMGVQIYTNAVDGIGFGVPIAWIAALLTFVVGFLFTFVFMTSAGAFLVRLYRRWERKNLE